MTQLPPDYAQACDALLREGRDCLARGELASASAKGWDAAVYAANAYAGRTVDFKDAVLRLSKDRLAATNGVEWAMSAMALAENARYDWLDSGGVGRRLDDVQRLVMLVYDSFAPPQSADAILRHARVCLANSALVPACEKGWEAVTYAAKTYAEVMGYDYIRSNYLDQVTPLLMKETGREEVGVWSLKALNLLESIGHRQKWLDAVWVRNDLEVAEKLVTLVGELTSQKRVG